MGIWHLEKEGTCHGGQKSDSKSTAHALIGLAASLNFRLEVFSLGHESALLGKALPTFIFWKAPFVVSPKLENCLIRMAFSWLCV